MIMISRISTVIVIYRPFDRDFWGGGRAEEGRRKGGGGGAEEGRRSVVE
jgi:hypothetical protein